MDDLLDPVKSRKRVPPDVIYLQWWREKGMRPDEVTWCEDRINSTDVEYRRYHGGTDETTQEERGDSDAFDEGTV